MAFSLGKESDISQHFTLINRDCVLIFIIFMKTVNIFETRENSTFQCKNMNDRHFKMIYQ
jgi:hypothetical protein